MDGKLEYKITIDGVEKTLKSVNDFKEAIKESKKVLDSLGHDAPGFEKARAEYQSLTAALKQMNNEISGKNAAAEQAKKVAEAARLAKEEARRFKEELKQADAAAKQIAREGLAAYKEGLKQAAVAAKQASKEHQQAATTQTHASSQASMALLNLNYVIRDSPYFFQNFALGVLAVGNNINPLIDSFSNLKKEAIKVQTETGKTTSSMSLLKGALVGGAGISIAFSLVVTAIQAFVFWMARSKDETEANKEAIDLHAESIKRLSMSYSDLEDEQQKVFRNIKDETLLAEKKGLLLSITGYTAKETDWSGITRSKIIPPLTGKKKTEAEERITEIDKILLGYNANIQHTTQQQTVFNIEIDKGVKSFLSYIKENQRTQEELEAVRRSLNSSRSEVGYLSDDYNRFTKRIEILDEVLGKHKDKIRSVTADIINYNEALRMVDEEIEEFDKEFVPKAELGALYFAEQKQREDIMAGDSGDYTQQNNILKRRRLYKEEQDKEAKRLRLINQLANQVGNTLSQAFIQGNVSLRSLIKSMEAFIAQLIIVQTVKGIFTSIFTPGGTFMSGFSTFANGGYLPRAEQGMVVPGVHTSGDSILARVNSGEMILNQRQQSTLFNMINKGGGGQQLVNVRVEGQIESRHDKFVIDFQRAKKRMEFKTYTGGL